MWNRSYSLASGSGAQGRQARAPEAARQPIAPARDVSTQVSDRHDLILGFLGGFWGAGRCVPGPAEEPQPGTLAGIAPGGPRSGPPLMTYR